MNIKFESQKKITNLINDSKSYRVVDFYLPRLNLYIEYNGMYFSGDKFKKEYDIKTQVYIKNSLPTIIIYPNEIGILDYSFHSKLKTVLNLEKFKSNKKLYRYLLNRYTKKGKGYLIFTTIFWSYLCYVFSEYPHGLDKGITSILVLTSGVISFNFGINFILNIAKYFYSKE